MKRLLITLYLGLSAFNVWASPASNIKLAYDLEGQMLHVEANHPTDREFRYFVRTVTITKNSQAPQDFYYTHQQGQGIFRADIPYKAEPLDHINVRLFVSEGGYSEASIDIPKKEGVSNEKKTVSSGE